MSVSPRGRITLPAIAVDVIQTRLRATLPAALKTVGFGSTEDERRMLHQRAWQELEARGLVRHGDLDPFLEDAFQILARPPLAVWALLQTDRENCIDGNSSTK
ncbi:ESX secretion-associated protein EspG [Actinoalloteichus caeruleus]|uniref:ESX secretion-associated protein EspG n=1 Tax=Actinoalloteichus cyanogriseus TaxID=2893586 RepID=UPI0020A454DA|nr:ESX secretion-associated protein EspG [Actinoalloteichus caeruleus]